MNKRYAIIAHDLSPSLGSEAGNAWKFILELEKSGIFCDVYCAKNNQLNTNNYETQINQSRVKLKYVKIIFCEQSILANMLNPMITKITKNTQIGSRFTYSFLYRKWLKNVESKILHENYDIVHLFNHISFRWPLRKFKKNVSYIWGPVSGASYIKINFLKNFNYLIIAKYIIRNIIIWYWINFGAWKSFAKVSRKVFTVTIEDKKIFETQTLSVEKQLDVFTNKKNTEYRKYKFRNKLKLLMIGRIDELKGLDLAIDSVKDFVDVELDIFGDGKYLEYFKKYARMQKAHNVKFHGHISYLELQNKYQEYHVLLHTSIKEAGSSTVLEALENGLPVITHEAFGMAVSITNDCGWLMPYKSYKTSKLYIKRIINEILNNPEIILEKSKASLLRSRLFLLDIFIDKIKNIVK